MLTLYVLFLQVIFMIHLILFHFSNAFLKEEHNLTAASLVAFILTGHFSPQYELAWSTMKQLDLMNFFMIMEIRF